MSWPPLRLATIVAKGAGTALLRRMPLLRTTVNKAKKQKGRSPSMELRPEGDKDLPLPGGHGLPGHLQPLLGRHDREDLYLEHVAPVHPYLAERVHALGLHDRDHPGRFGLQPVLGQHVGALRVLPLQPSGYPLLEGVAWPGAKQRHEQHRSPPFRAASYGGPNAFHRNHDAPRASVAHPPNEVSLGLSRRTSQNSVNAKFAG